MHSMRKRALVTALAAVAVVGMLATAPAGAARHRCGGAGGGGGGVGPSSSGGTGSGGTGGGGHRRTCTSAGYVNPFPAKHWWAGRTDMGVDYGVVGQRAPVVAIGDAKVIGSDSKSGWPGGHFIWYRLLDGDHAGNVIFVAETLTRLVPKGTVVAAGQRSRQSPLRLESPAKAPPAPRATARTPARRRPPSSAPKMFECLEREPRSTPRWRDGSCRCRAHQRASTAHPYPRRMSTARSPAPRALNPSRLAQADVISSSSRNIMGNDSADVDGNLGTALVLRPEFRPRRSKPREWRCPSRSACP